MNYTKEDLIVDLKNMGLCGNETIMIHSSMKAIGEVDGGADTVINALIEFFEEGLLLLPTHTWAQMSKEYNTFNKSTEPACVGILPNVFMKREDVVRSLHPTHSVAAYGKNAKAYIADDEYATTPCPSDGSFGKLKNENGKILLVGVTHIRNTFIHSIEESFDVPERFTDEPVKFYTILDDGTKKEMCVYRHFNKLAEDKGEVISDSFDKLKELYYKTGAAKEVKFGDAVCILCDAGKLFDVTGKVLEKDKDFFMKYDKLPKEWNF